MPEMHKKRCSGFSLIYEGFVYVFGGQTGDRERKRDSDCDFDCGRACVCDVIMIMVAVVM